MVCKLSIVIPGSEYSGIIVDRNELPRAGDRLDLGPVVVEVLEVMELLPPRGDFHFVHATCRLVPKSGTAAAAG